MAFAGPGALRGRSRPSHALPFMEVLEQRRARGITDAEGKAASPLPSTLDRDAYGARVRADLDSVIKLCLPTKICI